MEWYEVYAIGGVVVFILILFSALANGLFRGDIKKGQDNTERVTEILLMSLVCGMLWFIPLVIWIVGFVVGIAVYLLSVYRRSKMSKEYDKGIHGEK
jgi:O-antigen/teichoic acid export membrane protein